MDYSATIEWLYSQLPVFSVIGPGAYKPGLDTSRLLDAAFGHRHREFPSIHVAGTNGKGSTSHMLASILGEAGYKVGLYTSPHIHDFRERMRIVQRGSGGKVQASMIPESRVVDFVERYRTLQLDCSPSFFELTTIMAFDFFASEQVDFAIIEVGLGGRLDTTNIISPMLSVITNVSLDHTALLGHTPEQIAREKAGIIKAGIPVVVSEAQGGVRRVFAEKAEAEGAPIVFAQDTPAQLPACDLQGDWQPCNANGVMHAVDVLIGLGVKIGDEAIIRGMAAVAANTGLIGRWMTLRDQPEVVCDSGHNPGAWQYLAPRLQSIANERQLRIVIGFANDKDVDEIFPNLPRNAQYYFVAPAVERAREAAELALLGQQWDLKGKAYSSVQEGYNTALSDSSDKDFIFIGGSNYVLAEL